MVAETFLSKETIKNARDLGYKGSGKYIWHACIECGRERWVQLLYGKPRSSRCHPCANLGNKYNWKGGQTLSYKRYVYIKYPSHPKALSNRGYVSRARLVLEEKLGRYLLPGYEPHHKNEIKTDDRPENLEEKSHGEHRAFHRKASRTLKTE